MQLLSNFFARSGDMKQLIWLNVLKPKRRGTRRRYKSWTLYTNSFWLLEYFKSSWSLFRSRVFSRILIFRFYTDAIAQCYRIACCRLRRKTVERIKVCAVWICYFWFEQKLNKHYQNKKKVKSLPEWKKSHQIKDDMIINDNSKFWLTRL